MKLGTILGTITHSALSAVIPSPSSSLPSTTPSPNILSYLETLATPSSSNSSCAIALSENSLVFPNAKIVRSPSGFIDCRPQLVLSNIPAGYKFSINSVTLSGYLSLERGSYVDKIQIQLRYPQPSSSSIYPVVDEGVAKSPYGESGAGYDGMFSMSLNMAPNAAASRSSRDGQLATSACSTGQGDRVVLDAELWVSLSHEQIEVDDRIAHVGSVGGSSPSERLRIGLDARWVPC
ncbi:hypothetical protein B0T17DRAFT_622092 [Bombardia bombarda]|uniref:Uncharacterized protein n=1 Tax=Bombardia bombarda TaxID=252184 RepID=A0AA39XI52_9PEZI|nr:hypothetical protein B0T17DRAFT_622092 [Bombardia bombarda]